MLSQKFLGKQSGKIYYWSLKLLDFRLKLLKLLDIFIVCSDQSSPWIVKKSMHKVYNILGARGPIR